MAGNIVKWWKHKIFGGYKQFSVLQECTTDSEELMYHQVRAPSTCSAPPDLLLVSDIENIVPIKTSSTQNSNQLSKSSTQQQPQNYHHQHNIKTKHKNISPLVEISNDTVTTTKSTTIDATGPAATTLNEKSSTKHSKNCYVDKDEENSQEEKMHLEEFTCDVSVENGKSSQPLQFSFTFYDLDGHHGKITKDDIVGIVYTIYESIGKSVVVPHCGSKTINVRLTVSPEGKSKTTNNNKLKKSTAIIPKVIDCTKTNDNINILNQHHHHHNHQHNHNHHHGHTRRQHRYRPRKLIKTDDEEDDTASDKDQKIQKNYYNKKYDQNKNSNINCQSIPGSSKNFNQNENSIINTGIGPVPPPSSSQPILQLNNCNKIRENLYNNKNNEENEKVNSKDEKCVEIEGCAECAAAKTSKQQYDQNQQFLKRAKILRKSRKHKDQIYESRQRSQSMSACNDRCWKKRLNEKQLKLNSTQNTPIHHQDNFKQNQDQQNQQQDQQQNQDIVDGIVSSSATTPTQKSWNNAFKRNDLIDIIRESMEKNRLCFQSNGKSQTNMSPVRHHRQRSNTVSKITTDLKKSNPIHYNHLYNHQYNQNKTIINTTNIDNNDNNGGIHVPIYHQQLLTNQQQTQQKSIPIEKGFKNHKSNLCGYDSYLHATICSGKISTQQIKPFQQQNNNKINNSNNNNNNNINNDALNINNVQNTSNYLVPKIIQQHQQQKQQQQPSTLDFFINQQNCLSPKIYINNSNIIKTNKHLRQQNIINNVDNIGVCNNGYYSQQNSPTFHGYQRLSSSTTTCNLNSNNSNILSTKLLKTLNPELNSTEQLNHNIYHVEKWLNEHNNFIDNTNHINNIKLMKNLYQHHHHHHHPQQQQQQNDNLIVENDNNKCKKDVKNYDNLLYTKLNEKLIEHNKINPIKCNLNNKENIRKMKNLQQTQQNEKLLKQQRKFKQQSSSLINDSNNKFDDNNLVPIFVDDPIECENLIPLITSEDDESINTPKSNKSSNHHHHHQHQQRNDDDSNKDSKNSSSSSTIHRYVHEHIHHHYHHFENKDEDD